MADHDRSEKFVQLLTEHQAALYSYIVALLGDLHEAQNVLQETNIVLWRKSETFEEGTSFSAWSRKVAYFQVMAFLRDRKRDKHLFDAQLMQQIAERPQLDACFEERCLALRHCLAALPQTQRDVVTERYRTGLSVKVLAKRLEKSESAVKMMMLRIRQTLLQCIRGKLAES